MTRPLLDLDLLKAFVAVATQKSFTHAARVLNRTQAAVSMQIKRLEGRVEVELFRRTRSSVDLTSAGENLLGFAKRILELNDEAVVRLRRRDAETVVRLGVMEDYGSSIIPPLLSAFTTKNPSVQVEMLTGLTAFMPARLGDAYDLVIAMHPQEQGEGQLLRRDRALWAVGQSHTSRNRDPLQVALFPKGCLFRKWAVEALDAAQMPWRLAFESHSHAAIESVVAQGMAITVFKASTFPRNLRPLANDEGMPLLPDADIRLHRAPNLSVAASQLADYLFSEISLAD
jgi:DNA-binding transcriptional LysR family regulator